MAKLARVIFFFCFLYSLSKATLSYSDWLITNGSSLDLTPALSLHLKPAAPFSAQTLLLASLTPILTSMASLKKSHQQQNINISFVLYSILFLSNALFEYSPDAKPDTSYPDGQHSQWIKNQLIPETAINYTALSSAFDLLMLEKNQQETASSENLAIYLSEPDFEIRLLAETDQNLDSQQIYDLSELLTDFLIDLYKKQSEPDDIEQNETEANILASGSNGDDNNNNRNDSNRPADQATEIPFGIYQKGTRKLLPLPFPEEQLELKLQRLQRLKEKRRQAAAQSDANLTNILSNRIMLVGVSLDELLQQQSELSDSSGNILRIAIENIEEQQQIQTATPPTSYYLPCQIQVLGSNIDNKKNNRSNNKTTEQSTSTLSVSTEETSNYKKPRLNSDKKDDEEPPQDPSTSHTFNASSCNLCHSAPCRFRKYSVSSDRLTYEPQPAENQATLDAQRNRTHERARQENTLLFPVTFDDGSPIYLDQSRIVWSDREPLTASQIRPFFIFDPDTNSLTLDFSRVPLRVDWFPQLYLSKQGLEWFRKSRQSIIPKNKDVLFDQHWMDKLLSHSQWLKFLASIASHIRNHMDKTLLNKILKTGEDTFISREHYYLNVHRTFVKPRIFTKYTYTLLAETQSKSFNDALKASDFDFDEAIIKALTITNPKKPNSAKAPCAFGFLSAPVASFLLSEHGFFDTRFTGNFAHGSAAHPIQMAFLSNDKPDFQAQPHFSKKVARLLDQEVFFQGEADGLRSITNNLIFPFSPAFITLNLNGRQFSQAIRSTLELLDQKHLSLKEVVQHFETENIEQIRELLEDIEFFEKISIINDDHIMRESTALAKRKNTEVFSEGFSLIYDQSAPNTPIQFSENSVLPALYRLTDKIRKHPDSAVCQDSYALYSNKTSRPILPPDETSINRNSFDTFAILWKREQKEQADSFFTWQLERIITTLSNIKTKQEQRIFAQSLYQETIPAILHYAVLLESDITDFMIKFSCYIPPQDAEPFLLDAIEKKLINCDSVKRCSPNHTPTKKPLASRPKKTEIQK